MLPRLLILGSMGQFTALRDSRYSFLIDDEKSMQVLLEVAHQRANLKKVVIRSRTVIGRGADCNLRIASKEVSRRHCLITVGDDNVQVQDLGSANGTFVNGYRLDANLDYTVAPDSELSLGGIKFFVRFRPLATAAATEDPGSTVDFADHTGNDADQWLPAEQEKVTVGRPPDDDDTVAEEDDIADPADSFADESDENLPDDEFELTDESARAVAEAVDAAIAEPESPSVAEPAAGVSDEPVVEKPAQTDPPPKAEQEETEQETLAMPAFPGMDADSVNEAFSAVHDDVVADDETSDEVSSGDSSLLDFDANDTPDIDSPLPEIDQFAMSPEATEESPLSDQLPLSPEVPVIPEVEETPEVPRSPNLDDMILTDETHSEEARINADDSDFDLTSETDSASDDQIDASAGMSSDETTYHVGGSTEDAAPAGDEIPLAEDSDHAAEDDDFDLNMSVDELDDDDLNGFLQNL